MKKIMTLAVLSVFLAQSLSLPESLPRAVSNDCLRPQAATDAPARVEQIKHVLNLVNGINEDAVAVAAPIVADTNILVFDIDYTLNKIRMGKIDESVRDLLYELIIAKAHGKKMRVISGRSMSELKKYDILQPLIKKLLEKNKDMDIAAYTSDGAGKYRFSKKNNKFEPVEEYNNGFTGFEAGVINKILEKMHAKIDAEQGLSRKGIDKYIVNVDNIKFEYSPYGKKDESEYKFEADPDEAAKYNLSRLTRAQLAEVLLENMHKAGVTDVAVIISGKTTIGFVRKGASKRKAIEDILKEDGPAVYFGDETGVSIDTSGNKKEGNDNVVAELASERDDLSVVSLDPIGGKKEVRIPSGAIIVGGQYKGTIRVLEEAYDIIRKRDPEEKKAIAEKTRMLKLCGFGKSDIKDIYKLNKGRGIHDPYYKVETTSGSMIFNYVNDALLKDTLEAARYEVWMVTTLLANGVPVIPLYKKIERQGWEKKPEDDYIFKGKDGRLYLLYEYIEDDPEQHISAGSFATLNDARQENMIKALAKMHKVLLKQQCPYQRRYKSNNVHQKGNSLLGIEGLIKSLEGVERAVEDKKKNRPQEKLSRGEVFVSEKIDFIIDQIKKLHRNLPAFTYEALKRIPIHGDFHPPNIIFKGDEVAGIFDWEYSKEEARIFEFASLYRQWVRNLSETKPGDPQSHLNIEKMKEIVTQYHRLNPLTAEEIETMPEIFRYKLLDRLSRLAVPARYSEGMDFDLAGIPVERHAIKLMDAVDELYKWHVDVVNTLWNLDEMISQGVFEREIIAPLLKQLESQKSETVLEEAKSKLKQELEAKPSVIEVRPLANFSAADILRQGQDKQMYDLVEQGDTSWNRSGRSYTNGWLDVGPDAYLIFDSAKVVMYRTKNGDIYIAVRGDSDERVRQGLDMALIKITTYEDGRIKSIDREKVGKFDLARTAIGIQLEDSNILRKFPELAKALRYIFVWSAIDTGARYRERRDTALIDMELINKLINSPGDATDNEIMRLEEMIHLKTKAIRRMALRALAALYDASRIKRKEFYSQAMLFLRRDIEEDVTYIERAIKTDAGFLRDLFKNVFNAATGTGDVEKVELHYLGQDVEKEVFRADIYRGKYGLPFKAAISIIRQDELGIKLGEKDIRTATSAWRRISKAGIDEVAAFGSNYWQYEYREKKLILHRAEKPEDEKTMPWVDDVQIVAREFIEGETLEEILASEQYAPGDKKAAIEACRQCARGLFKKTLENPAIKKGYFITDPGPGQFTLAKTKAAWKARIHDLDRLTDFPSERAVLGTFNEYLLSYLTEYVPDLAQYEAPPEAAPVGAGAAASPQLQLLFGSAA